jgi:hypothetical protein
MSRMQHVGFAVYLFLGSSRTIAIMRLNTRCDKVYRSGSYREEKEGDKMQDFVGMLVGGYCRRGQTEICRSDD